MAVRAGYTTHVFILDCSRSMGQRVLDPTPRLGPGGEPRVLKDGEQPDMVQKLNWAKEYISRRMVDLVSIDRDASYLILLLPW